MHGASAPSVRCVYLAPLFLMAVLHCGQAFSQSPDIAGQATALDGDTIAVTDAGGTVSTVRLFGLDAPEMTVWPDGAAARAAMDRAIGGQPASCDRRGASGSRVVALCRAADGRDLAETLIREGRAVPYRKFTLGTPEAALYEAAETKAIAAARGICAAAAPAAKSEWHEGASGYWTRLAATAATSVGAILLATFLAYRNALRVYNRTQIDRRGNALSAVVIETVANLTVFRNDLEPIAKALGAISQGGPYPDNIGFPREIEIDDRVYSAIAGEMGRYEPQLSKALIVLNRGLTALAADPDRPIKFPDRASTSFAQNFAKRCLWYESAISVIHQGVSDLSAEISEEGDHETAELTLDLEMIHWGGLLEETTKALDVLLNRKLRDDPN